MTSPRKSGFVLPVAVTLAVLLGLYVGAYYAMVEPIPAQKYVLSKGAYSAVPTFLATYSRWDDWLTPLFSPAHWLDRRIRPHVWEPTP